MATNRIHINKYQSTLNGAINNSTTSVVVTSATGLPTLSGSEYYFLTIDDGTNAEIIKVTSRTSNTLTVVRGQDGTSGTAFADGVTIAARVTRESLDTKAPLDEDILPDTDATYDLGSGSFQFVDLYLSGNTIIGGDVSGTTIGGITEANLVDKAANEAITGNWDFGGASSLEVPNGAAPTVDAAGEFAIDTTITDHTGLPTYHDGTEALYCIAIPTGNLTTTDGHVISYNATNNEFEMTAASGGLNDVVDDATPQLGGNLDLNGYEIQSVTALDIKLHSDNNILCTLGDAAGVDDFRILDSGSSIVFQVTSDGQMTINGSSAVIDTILDEDDMASNDANAIATQQSIKAYVDAALGLTLISTASASASSSIDFTGIDSTYDRYLITMDNVNLSADANVYIRTSTDGGSTYDSSASNYDWHARNMYTTTANSSGSTGDTEIQANVGSLGGAADENFNGEFFLYSPSATTYTSIAGRLIHGDTGNLLITEIFAGRRLSAADVDAIRILPSTGNFTTGEFKLYGYKAS